MTYQEQHVMIPAPSGQVAAILTTPDNAQHNRIVIVCHPHPQQGGTMNNKVVTTLIRAWRDLGALGLRFNYRGVGESDGKFDEGRGETEDLLAVIRWVKSEYPEHQIDLGGFSFGGYVAVKACQQMDCDVLVLVGPAVIYEGFPTQLTRAKCAYVLQGDADDIIPPEAVYTWVDHAKPKPKLLIFDQAGHFFHGRLVELHQKLTDCIGEPD